MLLDAEVPRATQVGIFREGSPDDASDEGEEVSDPRAEGQGERYDRHGDGDGDCEPSGWHTRSGDGEEGLTHECELVSERHDAAILAG